MIEYDFDVERRARYYAQGFWKADTLLDKWNEKVSSSGDSIYVIDEHGTRKTYREVDELATRLASHLSSKGIGEGEVVTIQLSIWHEFVVAYVACLKIGAVIHPVSRSFNERDLASIMGQVGTTGFICMGITPKRDYAHRARLAVETVGTVKAVVVVERDTPGSAVAHGFDSYERIVAAKLAETSTGISRLQLPEPLLWTSQSQQLPQLTQTTSDSVALILSTSGTTGMPKAVLLTHNNIIFSETVFTTELGLDSSDIMFMPAPLNHATGFNHGLISPMLLGGSVVLQERFEARSAIELMNREHVTWSMGATPFIYDMLNVIESTGTRAETLRFYLCGGAPVPGAMVQRARECGIVLCEVYGSTESCPHVYVPPTCALEWDGRFSGKPFEGIEVKVVDDNRNVVGPGIQGEEASRGPHLFVGYLKNPEATDATTDEDGWFYSGDLCVMDEEGRIRINGRKKEIIIRGGENISAVEVDNHVHGCPGVLDNATVGIPDERLGERICTFIVPEGGVTVHLEDLVECLGSRRVNKRLWPEHIELIDSIPRTESGKVKRNELVSILLDRLKER